VKHFARKERLRTYFAAIACVHKSACFFDPIRGIAKHHPSVDIRSPLSTHDLKKLTKALSASEYTTFTLALFKAMFALMFLAFFRVREVTKWEHNISVSKCRITKPKLKLNFISYCLVQVVLLS